LTERKLDKFKLWPDRAGLVRLLVKLSSIVILSQATDDKAMSVCKIILLAENNFTENKGNFLIYKSEIREHILLFRKQGWLVQFTNNRPESMVFLLFRKRERLNIESISVCSKSHILTSC